MDKIKKKEKRLGKKCLIIHTSLFANFWSIKFLYIENKTAPTIKFYNFSLICHAGLTSLSNSTILRYSKYIAIYENTCNKA